jgi:GT2 family glycosyltransferase
MHKFDYKISLVILNWNGIHHLKRFLPSVVKFSNSEDTEIVIADNGSTDESVDYVKHNFPEIRLICFDKNYGFTGGYNKALRQLNSEYFILLNSDVEVTENWINPIIKHMDEDSLIAAAMPKILSYNDKMKFEYAGASGGYIDKFGYPFCRGRVIGEIEIDNGQYDKICDIFWASGTAMFVRSRLYNQFGGLDDDFFAHMEEIDLCWRLKNEGYRVIVVPESKVFHVGGGTLPNNTSKKIYLNYRNNLLLLLKNLPANKLFPIIFSRMILDGFSGIVYIFRLDFKFLFAVLKAHFSFYSLFFKTIKKRNSSFRIKNHQEIYKKSIVFDYYLRKKKIFNKLEKNILKTCE